MPVYQLATARRPVVTSMNLNAQSHQLVTCSLGGSFKLQRPLAVRIVLSRVTVSGYYLQTPLSHRACLCEPGPIHPDGVGSESPTVMVVGAGCTANY